MIPQWKLMRSSEIPKRGLIRRKRSFWRPKRPDQALQLTRTKNLTSWPAKRTQSILCRLAHWYVDYQFHPIFSCAQIESLTLHSPFSLASPFPTQPSISSIISSSLGLIIQHTSSKEYHLLSPNGEQAPFISGEGLQSEDQITATYGASPLPYRWSCRRNMLANLLISLFLTPLQLSQRHKHPIQLWSRCPFLPP